MRRAKSSAAASSSRREMGDAAAGRVGERAAEPLRVDVLVGHRLHDVRSGDEHVARALDHDREVGDGRRVDRSPGARPHDHRELRDDARGERVAQEDVGVSAERDDALLDPRAAGIVEPDDRRADAHRQVHDLADLLGVRLGQRAAEHREVLAEDEDEPAVDRAVAGHDAVAEESLVVESELARPLRDERVELHERARIEQQVEALARGQLAPGVLPLDADLAAAQSGRLAHLPQAFDPVAVR